MSVQHTVEFLAAEAGHWLTRITRDNGRSVVVAKDGAPTWIGDLCQAAHASGGELLFPDDWRYEFTQDALSALADGAEDPPDRDDVYPYTADRLRWLASRSDRSGYCDDAAEEYGVQTGSVLDLIALGMARELDDVFQAVRSFLADRVEHLDAEATGDDAGD
ncbi:MAG: hypothetical protein U0871_12025 [Gemmataceae bacterium]